MTFEALRANIEQGKNLIENLALTSKQAQVSKDKKTAKILNRRQTSILNQLKIINNAIPELINNITLNKEAVKNKEKDKKKLIGVAYTSPSDKIKKFIVLNKENKKKFLQELSINEDYLKQLKKRKKIFRTSEKPPFKKRSLYTKISNKFFFNISSKMIEQNYFRNLGLSLRKANFRIMLNSYVSCMLFSTLLSFFVGILLTIFLLFFNVNVIYPFFSMFEGDKLMRLLQVFWIIIAIPILTFFAYYFYPLTEKDSIGKKIDKELPFVAIQMSAIASAEIEPSNIFKIIAIAKDYKYTGQEAKKIVNQVNLYGYSIINALRNVARITPSKKFSELLGGMATTITSGGELSKYLDEISKSLMLDYRLREEKYTKLTETFMDLYISVVIAAPMLLMLLISLIKISGMGFGMSMGVLTLIIVASIAILNIIFLAILHLNQSEV